MKTVVPGKLKRIDLTEAVKKWTGEDDAAVQAVDDEIFAVMMRHMIDIRWLPLPQPGGEWPRVFCSCGAWCHMKPRERARVAHMRHVAEKIAARLRELG